MMLAAEREQIVSACRALLDQQLVVGTAGNVSVRVGDSIAISPSGVDYRVMRPEHVVVVALDGSVIEGSLKPSSELPLHLAIYQSFAHNAIVHTHAVSSTALSTVVEEIPLSHYYSALFGGAVRVAPYATFGSEQLAVNVRAALQDRTAALMSNHGAVSVGSTLKAAFEQLPYLEYVCELHLKALATGRDIKVLDVAEIEHVKELLTGYGQQAD